MSNPYAQFCDDYAISLRVATQIPLPQQRETLVHFFEQMQKLYPGMTRFRRQDNGDSSLEEDRTKSAYRWIGMEPKRLSCGYVNAPMTDDWIAFATHVLEMASYQLGVSPVELDYFDVSIGFDLEYAGNHDEIVSECMLSDSPLLCLTDEPGVKAIDLQPVITFALTEDLRTQARVDVITRSGPPERTSDSPDLISVFLGVRQFAGDSSIRSLMDGMRALTERVEKLASTYVIPRIVKPLSAAIASRS
jgi:hypothetical protein